LRVCVIGSSGSGKSTFAARLAAACDLARVEIDALNWAPGWTNRSAEDPALFQRLIEEATAGERWVTDGNYRLALSLLLPKATHLIWLDYARSVVMRRVVTRSLQRALSRQELWPGTGNREEFGRWLAPDHPIRWAWDTFARRRLQYEALFEDPRLAHLQKHRLPRPSDGDKLIARLAADASLS